MIEPSVPTESPCLADARLSSCTPSPECGLDVSVIDLSLTDDQQLLARSVRAFAEAEIRPRVREWDEAQQFPHELLPALADLGLMGIQIPEAYGGAGMSAVDYCIALEELARVDPSVALSVAAHNGLGTRPPGAVRLRGAEGSASSRRWRSGRQLAAWGLTEAGSGSDAAAMRTTAVRDGDGWVLNGAKSVHHPRRLGRRAGRDGRDRSGQGHQGHLGVRRSSEARRGSLTGKKEDKLGMRASETAEVILEQCRVPADSLIGEEGQGFIQTLQVLDAGRIGIAALAVGLAQGAYETARSYAFERRQFGALIGTFAPIRAKLVGHATRVQAARLLTHRAAWLKDQGRRMTLESSMAKLYASEIAVRASEDAVQILGGYGFIKDYPAEKFFRDVKLTTIGEGTSEIQRLVIARQLLAPLT